MKQFISLIIIALFTFSAVGCKKEKAKDDVVARKGLVNFVNGTVKLSSATGTESAAKVGDQIIQGMKIKTIGDKSFVDIYFGKNAVKILGDTEVEVKKLITNLKTEGEESSFLVGKGQMFSKISQKLAKSDSYEIRTPTSTAGVRGTQFLVKEENGKANIACLQGQLEVLNNSMPKTPVTIESNKECDIESDKAPMVKKLSDENKMLMENIVKGIQDMRDDIRRQFEQQREEIRKHVRDQKEKNAQMMQEQRDKDRGLVQDQKEGDKARVENLKEENKARVDAIKGTTKDKANESTRAAKDQMDAAKNVNKNASKDAAKSQMDSMKPKIKKMKIKKPQFNK